LTFQKRQFLPKIAEYITLTPDCLPIPTPTTMKRQNAT
jgi:hypothetical protein